MYDIKPLEDEWTQYKKNKNKPYLYALLGILILLIAYSIYSYKSDFLESMPTSKNLNNKQVISTESTIVILSSAINKIQVRNVKNIEKLKPEVRLNDMEAVSALIPTLPIVYDIPIIDEPKIKYLVKPKLIIETTNQNNIEISRKKVHLNIIESSSVSAYKDVEKRFYESHDTDDSLFLAKSYYRKSNYVKSEYWSLQTNKINANIEESWLIFVKSKVKLGHKNEAIRILTNYAKRSNSQAAWNLLLKLK